MREGLYLLALAGKEYGHPVTVKTMLNPDGTPFTMVFGIEGVRLMENLQPGDRLLPLLAMTPERVEALLVAANVVAENNEGGKYEQVYLLLDSMLEEVSDDQKNQP